MAGIEDQNLSGTYQPRRISGQLSKIIAKVVQISVEQPSAYFGETRQGYRAIQVNRELGP